MTRLLSLGLVLALAVLLPACNATACTLADCESVIIVDYGDLVIQQPYSLTINPGGMMVSVTCLEIGPDTEPLPDWIECTANGFEVTGDFHDTTTVTVGVVGLDTQESLIANALVPVTVDEIHEPNGPDCGPVCYTRSGSTQGL